MEVSNSFFTKKKIFFTPIPWSVPSNCWGPLIAAQCITIVAQHLWYQMPLWLWAAIAPSHQGRGCVLWQGNISPDCVPLSPGSQHGGLPVHAGRSSSAFSCPPHTNTHMGPSCGPWPPSQWEAPSRRAEKDRGCNRKRKRLQCYKEEKKGHRAGIVKRWGYGEDAALQVVQRYNADDTM